MATFFSFIRTAWAIAFGWLPLPLFVLFTLGVAFWLVILIIKLIALILDAIPFL